MHRFRTEHFSAQTVAALPGVHCHPVADAGDHRAKATAQDKSRRRVPATASFKSGEGGIRSTRSLQHLPGHGVSPKPSVLTKLRSLQTLLVVCGCLLILGIIVSAVSAHLPTGSEQPIRSDALPCSSASSAPVRARAKGDDNLHDDDEADGERAGCYARYSSESQREDSISDQLRTCREAAAANGHRIPNGLVFSDEAISGTKRRRAGLDAMLKAAEQGRFRTMYFYSLSRLSRESVITLPLLKRLVFKFDVRIISISDGIDTGRPGWETHATMMSVVHEQFLRDLSSNVTKGQIGTVLADFATGGHCYGYRSEELPGSETTRRGRNPRPRRVYVIDEETSPWVRRIFSWFVEERRSIGWITRELNRLRAPKSRRSLHASWYCHAVHTILRNRKYVGIWQWGKTRHVRDPETGDRRILKRQPHEIEGWTRNLPHLRLIDDETFAKAQAILDKNSARDADARQSKGRLNGSRGGKSRGGPRHLLAGLIQCHECERSFVVAGVSGDYLTCPGKRTGECNCSTMLNRKLAEQLILDHIGQRILASPEWIDAVYTELLTAWSAKNAELPKALADAQRRLSDAESRIARLVDKIEAGLDDPDVHKRLARRRRERTEAEREVKHIQRESDGEVPEPTREWLEERLRELGQTLAERTPAAALALQNLIGGKIVVKPIPRPGTKKHYLRGTMSLQGSRVVNAVLQFDQPNGGADDGPAEQITIDFIKPRPADGRALEAMALAKTGLQPAEIAERVKCTANHVRRLLHRAGEILGVVVEDGRAVRRRRERERHAALVAEQANLQHPPVNQSEIQSESPDGAVLNDEA